MLSMWLFIHAGIKVVPCLENIPQGEDGYKNKYESTIVTIMLG